MIVYLRLAFGDALRRSRPAGRSRARSGSAARRRCSPGRWRRSSSRGPRCSRCTARSTSPSSCSRSIFVGCAGRRGAGTNLARARREPRCEVWLWLGVVLGWLLWHVEGAVTGDGLFHEARVRKLVDLTILHLRSVDEFKDGGLHPGYAFPLWHELLALVSWFSGVDPGVVVRHEPSLLVPLACAVTYEAGVAVFGSRGGGRRRCSP